MKVRCDYVTNSSSSSYIVLSMVDRTPELDAYMKEEYGKYGIRLLDKLLLNNGDLPETLAEWGYCIGEDEEDGLYSLDIDVPLDSEKLYLISEYYTYTTEGSSNDDDVWLLEHLPKDNVTKLCETEPD